MDKDDRIATNGRRVWTAETGPAPDRSEYASQRSEYNIVEIDRSRPDYYEQVRGYPKSPELPPPPVPPARAPDEVTSRAVLAERIAERKEADAAHAKAAGDVAKAAQKIADLDEEVAGIRLELDACERRHNDAMREAITSGGEMPASLDNHVGTARLAELAQQRASFERVSIDLRERQMVAETKRNASIAAVELATVPVEKAVADIDADEYVELLSRAQRLRRRLEQRSYVYHLSAYAGSVLGRYQDNGFKRAWPNDPVENEEIELIKEFRARLGEDADAQFNVEKDVP